MTTQLTVPVIGVGALAHRRNTSGKGLTKRIYVHEPVGALA